jgi:hypothetical protein
MTKMKLEEVWSEENLAKQLGFNLGGSEDKPGRSRTITRLISEGLEYINIYNRRYFCEEDVVTFMLRFKEKPQAPHQGVVGISSRAVSTSPETNSLECVGNDGATKEGLEIMQESKRAKKQSGAVVGILEKASAVDPILKATGDPQAKKMGVAKIGGVWYENCITGMRYRVEKVGEEYKLMETKEKGGSSKIRGSTGE